MELKMFCEKCRSRIKLTASESQTFLECNCKDKKNRLSVELLYAVFCKEIEQAEVLMSKKK